MRNPELLAVLRQLKEHGPTDRSMGICGNANLKYGASAYAPLAELMAGWPERWAGWPERWAGTESYPVGGYDEYQRDDLWNNPRRHALLDWCIAELEKEE